MSENSVVVQSLGESIANSVSHGCGGALILLAAPSLIMASYHRGGAWGVVGASIFVGAAFALYLISTLYHALPPGGAKQVFRRLDHSAIFLMIAGTYTPFVLGVLRGPWGWSLFGVIWGLAVVGVAMKVLAKRHHEWLSVGLYVIMGWLVVIAADPMVRLIPIPGILLLLAGGLAYTLGVLFYAWDRLPYFHFTWHLFVLAGTVFHYIAVWNYAA
jgi:hemolysin III